MIENPFDENKSHDGDDYNQQWRERKQRVKRERRAESGGVVVDPRGASLSEDVRQNLEKGAMRICFLQSVTPVNSFAD